MKFSREKEEEFFFKFVFSAFDDRLKMVEEALRI